jgi:hypothetical protein
MVHGSVVASFGVEAFSLERLQGLEAFERQQRVEALCGMMQVDL